MIASHVHKVRKIHHGNRTASWFVTYQVANALTSKVVPSLSGGAK